MPKRPFEFKEPTQDQARLRQDGRCAHCGENLDDLYEAAHHVIPNQSGNPRNPNHAWLTSVENCVVLCGDCHDIVHDGSRFRYGAVAPPSYFPFSHGENKAAHHVWIKEMESREKTIWR
jgi:hypothetical protein